MSKSRIRPQKRTPAAARGRCRTERREARTGESPPSASAPGRSEPMQLAAEVERLRAELAAARAHASELEARAERDPLLDLLNRRGFERELRRSLAYVRRYGAAAALIYLDLDRFKPVNDRYGHAAGDRMLQAVALSLQRSVRESDVVARLGGDEFGILLWNLDESQAAAKAVQLEAVVAAAAVLHDGARLTVGASAGCAMLSGSDSPEDIIARADEAMYRRKRMRR